LSPKLSIDRKARLSGSTNHLSRERSFQNGDSLKSFLYNMFILSYFRLFQYVSYRIFSDQMFLRQLPLEIIIMIVDYLRENRGYRNIEKIVALEDVLGLPSGTLLKRLPFEKALFDESTSMNQWISFTDALDQLAPNPRIDYVIAGGFAAHMIDRTNMHGDIDVFIFQSEPLVSPTTDVCNWHSIGDPRTNSFPTGFPAFRVYNSLKSPFQIIVIGETIGNIEDNTAHLLYNFDLQICQCAMMPIRKLVTVDTCMKLQQFGSYKQIERQLKYKSRLAHHGKFCKRVRCNHWEHAY